MWKIEQVFQKKFQPQCIKPAKCGTTEIPGKCICKNGKGGQLCDDSKSVFASILNPSNIKGWASDKGINELLYFLNFHTYKLEELMNLNYNVKCDPKMAFNLARIMDFYKDVGSSDETKARSKTFYQYQKVSKWIKYLLLSGVTGL